VKAASWVRVLDLFREVVDLDAAERERILGERCAESDDGDLLRREVDRLLDEDRRTSGPLDGAAARDARPVSDLFAPAPVLEPGTRVGSCEIRRVVASGGMGTVYEAVQDAPRRKVALKTLRAGLGSPARWRRFRLEAEILGRLQHPGVAEVHESGTHETDAGVVPYIVMELIEGGRDLVTHAREADLPLEARLRLFLEVCDAVHHGHQRGVLHCDLKPSNVLVDAHGRPKVIDFGVSQVVEGEQAGMSSLLLATGDSSKGAGTLFYMAPEQLAGSRGVLDVRCDVCALGTVLFELLTGRLPFDVGGKPVLEIVRTLAEAEPHRPSEVADLPRELDWIAARALERDRERRYASVHELAADLERYLAHEPVLAGPPGGWYRFRKLVRRNRAAFAVAALVLAVALTGAFTTYAKARDAAVQLEIANEANGFLTRALQQIDPELAQGREVTVREFVELAEHELAERPSVHPEVEASVRATLGETFRVLGYDDRAEPHLTRAFELFRERYGLGDERSLRAGIGLVEARLARPGLGEDLAALTALLARTAARRGAGDRLALEARLAQGLLLERQSRGREAKAVLQTAVAASEEAFGPAGETTLAARERLRDVLMGLGEKSEAAALVAAIQRDRPRFDPTDPRRIVAEIEDAIVLAQVARLDEAGRRLDQYLPELRRVRGDDHPLVSIAEAALGHALALAGRVDAASRHLDAAAAAFEDVRGRETDQHVAAMVTAGQGLLEIGRTAEAEAFFRKARAIQERSGGPPTSSSIRALMCLGNVHMSRNETEAAEDVYAEALRESTELLGGRNPLTLLTANNLSTAVSRLGRYDEALELVESVANASLEQFGPDDANHTLLARSNHGCYLRMLGRYDEAEGVLRDVLERRARVLGDEHADTLKARYDLALLLHQTGRLEEAQTELRDLLAIVERAPDADLSGRVSEALIDVLASAGETEEALDRLESGRLVSSMSIERMALHGRLLAERGDLEQAENAFDSAVGLAESRLPAGSWLRAMAIGARAAFRIEVGAPPEPELEHLEAWVATTREAFGEAARESRKAAEALARARATVAAR
jgi:tetratricopeptide (TPR) repeat protein